MSEHPPDRECFEYLLCPDGDHVDVDFELLDYRLFRCGICGTHVQITEYEVTLGPPDDPVDHVVMGGVAVGRTQIPF